MAKQQSGLSDLYALMHDPASGMRVRINAAIAASRTERLAMPGEQPPECIVFLRHIIDFRKDGRQYSAAWRREAAAQISYYERKCKRVELQYQVADDTETRESWRKLINGTIRNHLFKINQWPARKDILLGPDDEFELPAADPDVVLSAIMLGGNRASRRRRAKTIDERPPAGGVWSGTETERHELLRGLAHVAAERLKACGLS